MTPESRALSALIEERVRLRGRLPFSEFMDAVLYHPQYGYYARAAAALGPEGDFYTSPGVDPEFGACLVRVFRAMREEIPGFRLVEIGAGDGTLARQILELERFPYTIVERSAGWRAHQSARLAGFDVEWSDRLPDPIDGCVFSNEFFDALPVRRFVRRNGRVREIFIESGFKEVDAEPAPPIDLPLLEEGAAVDLSMDAIDWMERIGRSIRRGFHLTIDYGDLREGLFRRRAGALMCYRRHQADSNPYVDIGLKDITAHVNFSDLIDAGARSGMELIGIRTQMDFLLDAGALETVEALAGRTDGRSIQRMQALKTLLLPPMMGERFKVLAQSKGVSLPHLPGFRRRPGGRID